MLSMQLVLAHLSFRRTVINSKLGECGGNKFHAADSKPNGWIIAKIESC